ncbi:MAG: tape measure protein [Armatimonadota bacterium]|nr:tape measure protein [Armatimonadota bacterium]
MANNNIEIIITIRDNASAPIQRVAQAVQNLGNQAGGAVPHINRLSAANDGLSRSLKKISGLVEGVLIGMITFQALRFPGQLIGGFMDTVSATEQYSVSLESLVATQLLAGESGADMNSALADSADGAATSAGNAVRDVNERIQDAMTDHADRVTELQQSVLEAAGAGIIARQNQLSDALASLAEAQIDKIASVQAQIAELNSNFAEQISDRMEDFQSRMTDMAEAHARQREAILERVADENAKFEDDKLNRQRDLESKLSDLGEKHEEDRAALIKDLYNRTTKDKAKALLAGKLSEQEIDSLGLRGVYNRLKAEEEQYKDATEKAKERATEEERRAQVAHDKRVSALQKALAKEDAEYNSQVAKAEARNAKEMARAQREHDQRLAALNTRLTQENAKYEEQQAKLKLEAEKDLEELKARNEEKISDLEKRIARENALYERQLRDLSQSVAAAGASMAKAMSGNILVTAYQPQEGIGAQLEAVRDKAAEIVADLLTFNRQLAIWSPYSTADIQAMQQYYMGMGGLGVDTTKKLTTAMVDFGAAHGITADRQKLLAYGLAQVASMGRLQGQEMRQLAQAGMPVSEMAAAVNMNVKEFIKTMQDGALPADVFIEGLTNLANDRYAGAAKKLSTSWAGLGSTMNDIVAQGSFLLLSGAMDSLRIKIVPLIERIAAWVASEDIKKLGAQWSGEINKALDLFVRNILPPLVAGMKLFFGFMIDHGATVKAILVGVVAAIVIFAAAFAVAFAVIGLIMVVLVEAIKKMAENGIAAMEFFVANWKRLTDWIGDKADKLKEWLITSFKYWTMELLRFIVKFVQSVIDKWDELKKKIEDKSKEIHDNAVKYFRDMINDIVKFFRELPARLGELIGAISAKAVEIGLAIKDGIIAGIKGVFEGITSLEDGLKNALKTIINSAIDAVNDAIPDDISFEFLPGQFITIDFPDNPLPHLAQGARSFQGGMALVGEYGPELVKLPGGSRVYNASETSRMSGDNKTYVLNLKTEQKSMGIIYDYAILKSLAGAS